MAFSISKTYNPAAQQVANPTAYNTDIAALFDTINGIQSQTTTIGGMTIHPGTNSTTALQIKNSAGSNTFSVDTINNTTFFNNTYGLYKIANFTKDLSDASGDTAYTGIGFKPSLLSIHAVVDSITYMASLGYDDGSAHHSIYTTTTTETASMNGSGSITINQGVNFYRGYVHSMDDDGFTITWVKDGVIAGTINFFARAYR